MPRILGLDYGEKRLGFALSDPSGMLATPLSVEVCASEEDAVRIVRKQCEKTGAEAVVIGLPLNMNGSKGPQAQRVAQFAEKLRQTLGKPVSLWDERLSSRAVERTMRDLGVKARDQRGRVDKLAAQWMLQCYLDARALRESESTHEDAD